VTESVVAPRDQRVTFVELFFDLVFVFAVTQLVKIVHHHPGFLGAGEATLVFWMVWWAWTQFTWALNAADTTHALVELATLLATAIAFFMAVAIPGSFEGRGIWFAIPYVAVRTLGLTVYARVAREAGQQQHAAVKVFTFASVFGLVAVLVGGWQGGSWQLGLWAAAIALDLGASAVGARQEGWDLRAEHFAERHALFVIIALGESLIVAAAGVVGSDWNAARILVAILTVAMTCALWWVYFTRAKPALDHAFEHTRGTTQSRLARDAFSLMHFPLVLGIVAYAAAVEEALSHPAEALAPVWRWSLAAGLVLFLGSMGAALIRATGRRPTSRLALTLVTAIVVIAVPGPPALTFGLALAGVATIGIIEQRSG
jgi:low temperature requirement protein LtrA